MNEIRDFYFANETTEYGRASQQLIMESDIKYVYFILDWIRKQSKISRKNVYVHE